jgi:hypothetical protein
MSVMSAADLFVPNAKESVASLPAEILSFLCKSTSLMPRCLAVVAYLINQLRTDHETQYEIRPENEFPQPLKQIPIQKSVVHLQVPPNSNA